MKRTPAEHFVVMVGLASVGDLDLFPTIAEGDDEFDPNVVLTLEDIAQPLGELLAAYDYLLSPEFAETVAGKSVGFVGMKHKLEKEPLQRKERRDRLLNALAELPYNDNAYRLIDQLQHPILNRVRQAIEMAGGYSSGE